MWLCSRLSCDGVSLSCSLPLAFPLPRRWLSLPVGTSQVGHTNESSFIVSAMEVVSQLEAELGDDLIQAVTLTMVVPAAPVNLTLAEAMEVCVCVCVFVCVCVLHNSSAVAGGCSGDEWVVFFRWQRNEVSVAFANTHDRSSVPPTPHPPPPLPSCSRQQLRLRYTTLCNMRKSNRTWLEDQDDLAPRVLKALEEDATAGSSSSSRPATTAVTQTCVDATTGTYRGRELPWLPTLNLTAPDVDAVKAERARLAKAEGAPHTLRLHGSRNCQQQQLQEQQQQHQ
jgi:hypothetical protein